MTTIQVVLSAKDETRAAFQSAQNGLRTVTSAADAASLGFTRVSATSTAASGAGAALGQSQQQQAAHARMLATLHERLAHTEEQVKLTSTDAAGKVRILTESYERLSVAARQAGLSEEQQVRASLAAAQAQLQLTRAQNAQNRGLGPVLPHTLEQFGAGALGQFGVGLGVGALSQQLVQVGQESTGLAMKAETIGTAYEAATTKAGIGADALLGKLRQASRGTISDLNLELSANKALTLGVGQNIGQLSDLLAIARQRGKLMGVDTREAFQRIVEGLGKAEPEILDELGILIDANKVYKEYAKSIGVSAGELTKQQKVTAVTNEVLRTNSDLVRKNAEAQIDANDRIARSEARREASKIRAGRAILPAVSDLANTGAGAADALTGGLSPLDLLHAVAPTGSFTELTRTIYGLISPTDQLATIFRVLGAAEDSAVDAASKPKPPGIGERTPLADPFNPTPKTPAQTQHRMRYSPYANTLTSPAQEAAMISTQPRPGVQWGGDTYHVTVMGSLVHTGDIADGIEAARMQKERRGGFGETRGRR